MMAAPKTHQACFIARETSHISMMTGCGSWLGSSRLMSAVLPSWTTICTCCCGSTRPARRRGLTATSPRNGWLCARRVTSRGSGCRSRLLIAARADDAKWVLECRRRLSDLGWFMKFLKEPISRRANKEDGCTGAFWEGRFKSIAILDEASLLATCAYIDLNPVAAGIASTPEKSPHTSVKSRVEHCTAQGKLDKLRAGSPYFSKVQLEKGHWLFPIEDKRDANGDWLAGRLKGISLTGYLQLVDWSSRLVRPGKARVGEDAPAILARLQIDAAGWQATLEKLVRCTKKVGAYFGSSGRLDEVATQRGRHFLKNVTGRDTALTTTTPKAG